MLNLQVAMRKSVSDGAQTKELKNLSRTPNNSFYLKGILKKIIQPFQFIVRGAVTVRRTLEAPIGIGVTAETPDSR